MIKYASDNKHTLWINQIKSLDKKDPTPYNPNLQTLKLDGLDRAPNYTKFEQATKLQNCAHIGKRKYLLSLLSNELWQLYTSILLLAKIIT